MSTFCKASLILTSADYAGQEDKQDDWGCPFLEECTVLRSLGPG